VRDAAAQRQFLLFLLVGGSAAAAQWLSRFIFSLALPYEAAIAAAFVVGLVIAFELNRRYVFPSAPSERRRQFSRFLMVNLLAFGLVWLISVAIGDLLLPRFLPRAVAHAVGHGLGIISPVALSFMLHKRYTFREREAG
jgi:putative flippase GtrA